MRKPISTPWATIFGSESRAAVLYWLVVAKGNWVSAHNLPHDYPTTGYRTASKILEELSQKIKDIVKSEPERKYSMYPECPLFENLESIFMNFPETKPKTWHDGKKYWHVTYEKELSADYYISCYWTKRYRNYANIMQVSYDGKYDNVSIKKIRLDQSPLDIRKLIDSF